MDSIASLWTSQDRIIQIKDWLDLFNQMKILEIGIGNGDVLRYLLRKNTVYAVDISLDILNKAKSTTDANFIQADIRNLPFKDAVFRVVIGREVIEHVTAEEGGNLVRQISDILSPDGLFICSSPNRYSPEGILDSIYCKLVGKKWDAWNRSHKHVYNVFELSKLLKTHFHLHDLRGEYYLPQPLGKLSTIFPTTVKWLRLLRKITDRRFGRTKPFNRFGFVIEYFTTKKAQYKR